MRFYLLLFLLLFSPIFPREYNRLISLAPSFTKQIYLLGAENKLVANTNYCTIPEGAKQKPKIGNLLQLNIEKIVSFKPDLILTTSMSKPKQLENLRRFNIEVVTFPSPHSFTDLCSDFLKLAEFCSELEKGQEIINQAKKNLMEITDKTKAFLNKKKVFVQIGAKPLFAVIPGTYINEMIEQAGCVNTVKTRKSGIYSREKVLEENPDVIFISEMGMISEKEKSTWYKYSGINAAKNKMIFVLKSENILSPTPLDYVEGVKEIFNYAYKVK